MDLYHLLAPAVSALLLKLCFRGVPEELEKREILPLCRTSVVLVMVQFI
jgi:hypothetical protein